jgi:diaminopimelate epimerase
MTNIPFIKMHGLGNDFVIIDSRSEKYSLTDHAIAQIANRRRGVGCDQLVILENSANTDAYVRFYNADGTESGACGNATRCVAWLIMQENGSDSVKLESSAGKLRCKKAGDMQVSVNMGLARTGWHDIPLSREVDTMYLPIESGILKKPTAVSMGNPHAVFFVENAADVPLHILGYGLEHDELFPERANIGVAQVLSRNEIKLRVWERGTGETEACGTGACAAAFAAFSRDLVNNDVLVHLAGGDLKIEIQPDNSVIMTGPVAFVFSGNLEI